MANPNDLNNLFDDISQITSSVGAAREDIALLKSSIQLLNAEIAGKLKLIELRIETMDKEVSEIKKKREVAEEKQTAIATNVNTISTKLTVSSSIVSLVITLIVSIVSKLLLH